MYSVIYFFLIEDILALIVCKSQGPRQLHFSDVDDGLKTYKL